MIVRVAGGTRSFGIALSDYHPDTQLWAINGEIIGTVGEIPNFFATDTGRNGYLRIDASSDDALIESVTFFHAPFRESLEYDHVAFASRSISEPHSLALVLSSIFVAVLYSRRVIRGSRSRAPVAHTQCARPPR
jgi:hypothetical protein